MIKIKLSVLFIGIKLIKTTSHTNFLTWTYCTVRFLVWYIWCYFE